MTFATFARQSAVVFAATATLEKDRGAYPPPVIAAIRRSSNANDQRKVTSGEPAVTESPSRTIFCPGLTLNCVPAGSSQEAVAMYASSTLNCLFAAVAPFWVMSDSVQGFVVVAGIAIVARSTLSIAM